MDPSEQAKKRSGRRLIWALLGVSLLALWWLGGKLEGRYEVEASAWIETAPLEVYRELRNYADWPAWFTPLEGATGISIDEGDAERDPSFEWRRDELASSLLIRSAHPLTGLRYELRVGEEPLIHGAIMWQLIAGVTHLRWVEVTETPGTGWQKWLRFPLTQAARKRRVQELDSLLKGRNWRRLKSPI